MICVDELTQIFGIELVDSARRADEIAEHHRQLPAFGSARTLR